ncbi:MAG: hypothetical protein OEZ55_04690 [Nitrospinota bacterium]|nr:hypothetical protein [Nitrospinota bacterium]
MKYEIYNYDCMPDEHAYKSLLCISVNYCDRFMLVVRNDMPRSDNLYKVLNKLNDFLLTSEIRNKWPGTVLTSGSAKVNTYIICEKSIEVLLKAANMFTEWIQPNLPEDICILRPNLREWLVTISHENDVYMYLTVDEYRMVCEMFKDNSIDISLHVHGT